MSRERRLLMATVGVALASVAAALGSVSLPSAAREARVAVAGKATPAFVHRADSCEPLHYADLPVRAFRSGAGAVQLVMPHLTNRRLRGRDLGSLAVDCEVVLRSLHDPRPQRRADRDWIAATYAVGPRRVHALLHSEYKGSLHPGRCRSGSHFGCWHNTVTAALSTDGGRTYRRAPVGRRLVAGTPYRYRPDAGPDGVFSPSNIVRSPGDGHFYVLVHVESRGAQRMGTCVMRTRRLGDPRSWRAWDGSSYSVRFVDPYRTRVRGAAAHVCAPVSTERIQKMHESLTWNTRLGRWLLVGVAHHWKDGDPRRPVGGIYYSTSADLIDWSPRRLLLSAELPWTHRCGDRDPVLYPSLIDHGSPSRNFETTGRRAFLYFTRFNYRNCAMTEDRDLMRIPVTIDAG